MKASHLTRIILLIVFLLGGCISHTTFQTPEVLEPGQQLAGAGIAGWTSRYSPGRRSGLMEVDVFGRAGIARRVDAGIKLFGPYFGLLVDVKCQVRRSMPLVSVGLGGSYGRFGDMPDSGDDFEYLGLYPIVLVGSRKFYGGFKLVYVEEIRHPSHGWGGTSSDSDCLPGILLGACLEEGTSRTLPEVTIYLHPYEGLSESRVLIVAGIAFQHVSTPKQKDSE